jgi:diacylglycerol kinase (ATP)
VASQPPSARSFPQALAYAGRGLRHAARTQKHFRAQLIVAAAALMFSAWAGLPPVEIALLAVTATLVLAAELLNTAVEILTDLLHPGRGPAAAAIKDVAAGAVLLAAGAALAVGVLLFFPRLGGVSHLTARTISLVLAALCLVILVAGIARRPRSGS